MITESVDSVHWDFDALARHRLAEVERRIVAACDHAGRARQEVTLVGVTKTVDTGLVSIFHQHGLVNCAENTAQQLWTKAPMLPAGIRWHFIGHLQTNKIARTLPLVCCIHSIDSVHLLKAVDAEAVRQKRDLEVLLEVNASHEPQKHGFVPEEVPSLVPIIKELRQVQVRGLMTMAALQDPEACRPTFRLLRELRDRLRPDLPEPCKMEHLSMGMSNDFEVAIEEGATFVRLGSILFDERKWI